MATTMATGKLTDVERRQLKAYFEQTRPLPQLLSTLRSRRVARGYAIESGEAEVRSATGGRTLVQEKGPLAFKSAHPVLPLSEVEEALVAWSALGPNGMAHWDIAVNGGFHELTFIAGRTAAAPGNSMAHDLLVIKDEGAFIYNPGLERSKMVEIEGEADYAKVLGWYREGMRKVRDGRPDVDWALRVPGAPNASLFGPYQFNVNRPGTTWFIPITDIGWLYFSVLLNLFDVWHLYFLDDATQKPAGVDKWVGGDDQPDRAVPIPGGDLPAWVVRAEHATDRGSHGPRQLDLLRLLRRHPDGRLPRPREGARIPRRGAQRESAGG